MDLLEVSRREVIKMIIDVHTHIWPDAMAERTVQKLAQIGKVKAYGNGTLSSLEETMVRDGVDLSVLLPVITKPEQFETVNRVASTYNSRKGILSFGGIHPRNTDIQEKVKKIKSLGLKGIKIHPDYQGEFIDSIEYQNIIKEALRLGMIVVSHAGRDVGLYETIHCTPARVARLYEELSLEQKEENRLVLAHTGGCDQWEEVFTHLAGKKLYFDISFTAGRIDDALFVEIVKKHGAERMMFGTDYPWSSAKETMEWVKGLPLSAREKELILGGTARSLLGI